LGGYHHVVGGQLFRRLAQIVLTALHTKFLCVVLFYLLGASIGLFDTDHILTIFLLFCRDGVKFRWCQCITASNFSLCSLNRFFLSSR